MHQNGSVDSVRETRFRIVNPPSACVGDFTKLDVSQQSHALVLEIYRLTRRFPHEELYGLTAQLRRSAASIPANIAEGCGRHLDTELARFLRISLGSVRSWSIISFLRTTWA